MKIHKESILGRYIKLLPLELEHTQELHNAGNFPEIWTYVARRADTLENTEKLIKDALTARDRGTEFPLVIIDQNTDQIVGSTRFLNISLQNRSLQIGSTWLSPHVWRTHVNTECKYLLLRYCFETLGTVRVEFMTDSRNDRSQKAIERIGAIKEGILRNHRILPDGYIRDSVIYSVIEKEWTTIKKKLEENLTLK
ncbi:GNAT family protein [Paenibacillus sp. LHD-38]|uniref:GNAT family N-acetyltransferase n=1 Tax=Paenibacillus sp. LHD-38 TaxID=3072143 RepID=UPI00280FCB37|nr:GNAT family protein [Paenibacillus sp. LHD-38]MDQ8739098.1 GNAT family protein [Paenibacillus sp. LHD-38]